MTRPQWVGGQAVLEGVMMRYHDRLAVACRRSDNTINLISEKKVPLAVRYSPLGWPILRGMVSFFESLILGVHALNPVSYTHLDVYKRQALTCSGGPQLFG